MSKNKIHSTTQDFIDVIDIVEDVVLLKGKNACCILEVSSVNFFLLSSDEQNARIYGYMSLINSLSFALQILIISKRVDVGAYLKTVDKKIQMIQNPKLKNHLTMYRQFINELVKSGGILDKKIYIVVPYSYLEATLSVPGGHHADPKHAKIHQDINATAFSNQAKNALISKRAVVQTQVERMGLSARPLTHEELVKLFYEIFNNDTISVDFDSEDVRNVII